MIKKKLQQTHHGAECCFKLMLQENKRIRAKVPAVLEPLMIIHVDRLDRVIEPGLNAINWTSINADAYLADVHAAFQDFELLVDRVSDIITYRIDAVLSDMSGTTLVDLPADEPWTVDHFIERTQVNRTVGKITIPCNTNVLRFHRDSYI